MPSFPHEAPLVLFRECPELAVCIARDLFGLDIPPASDVRVSESEFTQIAPTQRRADLVIEVGGTRPVLGLILEVQRAIDRRKPYVWPAYTAALHERLGCQTCLVVFAARAQVAAWAKQPIHTFQPGSPFRPLVLGPDEVPRRIEAAEAARSPALAVLSAVVHGHGPDGLDIAFTAIEAIAALDDDRAKVFYDLILGSLPQVTAHALEQMMPSRNYEYQSEFARRYYAEGREIGEARGREIGEARGREIGEARGREIGEARGREIGEARGREIGEARGREIGLREGEERGRLAGRAAALVDILRRRGLAMTDAEAERILGCRDQALLARWWDRALTATTIAEFLAD